MNKKLSVFSIVGISALFIAACAAVPVEQEPIMEVQPEPVMVEETGQMEQTADVEQAAEPEPSYPDWYSAELTDVNSGEVFLIKENIGKVYLVETLATWCSKCYAQQNEVIRFHELLGERDDFESLGIAIDPNEDIPLLTNYVKKNGFTWKYIVASPEMIDEIGRLYGSQFLNPPSTPMLIIDREGNPHPLEFGIKSAEDLLEAVNQYL